MPSASCDRKALFCPSLSIDISLTHFHLYLIQRKQKYNLLALFILVSKTKHLHWQNINFILKIEFKKNSE